MQDNIFNEFENVTKFKLLQYFESYRDFLQNDFPILSAYYSGQGEGVDSSIINNYNEIVSQSKALLQTFKNFSSKLSNSGFWELQVYCQNLNDTLERIGKLPKYYRTSPTVRGYQPFVTVEADLGGMKTPQDIARELNSNGVTENSLLLDNDFQEDDWEIDTLSQMKVTVNNQSDVVVESILEIPVGEHVYGKDINKKITFKDNDLDIKRYQDNVEQKIETLLNLTRGDVPELPNFGRRSLQGQTSKNYNYAEFLKDIRNVFRQDDLFDSVEVSDVSLNESDLVATCKVRTKYEYSSVKTITL